MAATRSEDGGTQSGLTKKGVKKVMRYRVKNYRPPKVGSASKPRRRTKPIDWQVS